MSDKVGRNPRISSCLFVTGVLILVFFVFTPQANFGHWLLWPLGEVLVISAVMLTIMKT